MSYMMVLTHAGAALLAAAQAGGPDVLLTHIAAGDGGGGGTPILAPLPTRTALVGEVWRGSLASLAVSALDPSVIVAEGVIPAEAGGWQVHELGVFASDGTLFAYGNFPATYKPVAVEGSTREMILQASIRVGVAADVTLMIDPSLVGATRAWCLQTFLQKAQNLADLPDKAAARANLGLSDDFLASLRVPDAELYFAGAGF